MISHEDKEQVIFDFYNKLIGSPVDWEVTINLEELNIAHHDLATLEAPFTEEVWRTVSQLPGDKAPGPDGFIGRFYHVCWPLIKEDTNFCSME